MHVGVLGQKNSAAVSEAAAEERRRPLSWACFAILGSHHHDQTKPLPVRPVKPLFFDMLVAISGSVPHGAPEQRCSCCLT